MPRKWNCVSAVSNAILSVNQNWRLETYRQGALAENDNVHVERLEIGLRVRVLVERSETDEIVVPKQLDLFARLFEQDILSRQGVDAKDLLRQLCVPKLIASWCRLTLESILISSSVGDSTSSHHVNTSLSSSAGDRSAIPAGAG